MNTSNSLLRRTINGVSAKVFNESTSNVSYVDNRELSN